MLVTIAREFGAGAVSIAQIVSRRCGLRLLVDDVNKRAAHILEIAPEDVLSEELRTPTFLERLSESLPGANIDVGSLTDESLTAATTGMRRTIESMIRTEAWRGDAIFVGWAADRIIGPRPDLVRIFLHAPREWRVQRLKKFFAFSEKEAQAEIARVDAARCAHAAEYYHTSWYDARTYDLTLDTSLVTFEMAAEILITAIAGRSGA